MKKDQIIFVLIFLIILSILGFLLFRNSNKTSYSGESLDNFAKCLSDKKLTMYGAVWCSHCQNEKSHFGDSFKYVPYVECPENEALCLAKGIEGYPTWIDANGTKYVGEQGLSKLSEISACPLPLK